MCLAEAFLNIVLSIIFVQRLGIWGVALGTILAQLLTNCWFTPWYALRQLSIASPVYMKRVLLPAWVSILFALFIGCLLNRFESPSTLLFLGVKIGVLASCYGLFYVLLLRWLQRKDSSFKLIQLGTKESVDTAEAVGNNKPGERPMIL